MWSNQENRVRKQVKNPCEARKIKATQNLHKIISTHLLTLLIYEHDFSNESQILLYKNIAELAEKQFNKEDLKQRKELISLYNFLQCNSKYTGYKFRKELRPDFILTNDKEKIGVEITELTTQDDKIIDAIMKECSNKGLSEAQIRDQIKKSHGRKVENFDLAMFNNKMAVGVL